MSQVSIGYFIALDAWLFLTVLFANFATALAEARGKAQASPQESAPRHDSLSPARRRVPSRRSPRRTSRPGDRVVVEAGQTIPGDGEIIEGVASVDESAITGESAPVIRASGGDRSGVTGGTAVLSDRIVVRITSGAGESFLDRMIALVEGAIRQRSPNEIALTLLLSAFTLVFLIVVIPLWPMAWNAGAYMKGYLGIQQPLKSLGTDVPTLIALLVCLIPTTIGALLAAIGIAGMDRALQANIIAKSGKAVEMAGDVDVVLLDKTGTITIGNRNATTFLPVGHIPPWTWDGSPRSPRLPTRRPRARASSGSSRRRTKARPRRRRMPLFVPFTAQTRMSGVDLPDGSDTERGVRRRDPIRQGEWWQRARRPRRARPHGRIQGRDPPRRCRREQGGRGGRPRGHPEAPHGRALRAPPQDGPQDRHDHRRQPPHCGFHRREGGGRRLSGRGDAGDQARLHPEGAGRAASSSP